MWGLRSPTPRGRTESCTLHILADVLTGAHGERLRHCGLRAVPCGLRSRYSLWIRGLVRRSGVRGVPVVCRQSYASSRRLAHSPYGAHWPPATKSEPRERTRHCGEATSL